MGFLCFYLFCYALLCIHSGFIITSVAVDLLFGMLPIESGISVLLFMVERLFLSVSPGCLRFVIVVFPDHTHLLFLFCYALLCVRSGFIITLKRRRGPLVALLLLP